MGPQARRPPESLHGLPIDPDRVEEQAGIAPLAKRRARRVTTLVIGAAGAAGALTRYGITLLLPSHGASFPWDTFAINTTGSFVIGFVLVLLMERFPRALLARPLVATGFIGAYTTFSSYAVESVQLLRHQAPGTFVAYLAGSLFAGLAAVVLGLLAGRGLIHLERQVELGVGPLEGEESPLALSGAGSSDEEGHRQ